MPRQMMEAFIMQRPTQDPNCPENTAGTGWGELADPADSSVPRPETAASGTRAGSGTNRRAYGQHVMLKGAAGRADTDADRVRTGAQRGRIGAGAESADHDIDAILADVAAKRSSAQAGSAAHVKSSSASRTSNGAAAKRRVSGANADRTGATDAPRKRRPAGAKTGSAQGSRTAGGAKRQSGKLKKKKKSYGFVDVLKLFVPWRGDSGAEAARKIVFSSALVVVGVCTFLISNYYLDLYQAKKEYQAMQEEVEAARARRGFQETATEQEDGEGGVIEYLDYNYVGEKFLPQNPDLVGYIRIPDTLVSYPVAQKRSSDPNENMNDYYLYRTFHQEHSNSGCIFMDFRCNFDVVADHRRVYENSDNLLIYGHNMNNQTMFGSLRNYVNNPSYYMQHPIVELDSCYNSYDYKIFAVFIVDGEDYESKYAFNVWNVIDFANEDEFYDYVNNAKKRTMICNDVDVKYGDPLLTLYTCNGLVKNAKLIITARLMRAGEDRLEGTQDATLNDNVMYPQAYYNYGHPENFDESRFVPYGPDDSEN